MILNFYYIATLLLIYGVIPLLGSRFYCQRWQKSYIKLQPTPWQGILCHSFYDDCL